MGIVLRLKMCRYRIKGVLEARDMPSGSGLGLLSMGLLKSATTTGPTPPLSRSGMLLLVGINKEGSAVAGSKAGHRYFEK